MLVVKKYPNRRLYDTVASRYITLEALADLVRSGIDVLVQDAHTGEDLTQATLTQIILESRGGARLLPVPLLVRLIRMGDEALAEFLGRYVSWALELYVGAKQGARSLLPLNPLATAPFAATDALARFVLGATQWGNPPPPAAAHTHASPVPPPSEPMGEQAPGSSSRAPAFGGTPGGAAPGPRASGEIDGEPSGARANVEDVADQMARLRREIDELRQSVGVERSVPRRTPKSKAEAASHPTPKRRKRR